MMSSIRSKEIMFGLLAATVLGVGLVASADKAAKPVKTCASCCKPKPQSTKGAAAPTTAAKGHNSVGAKARSKAPVAKSSAKKMTPVAGAGWIYREPGSAMPPSPVGKSVIVPRIQAAKDPKDGVSMTLPPTTASVATVNATGHVDYECETGAGAGHSHQADKKHK